MPWINGVIFDGKTVKISPGPSALIDSKNKMCKDCDTLERIVAVSNQLYTYQFNNVGDVWIRRVAP